MSLAVDELKKRKIKLERELEEIEAEARIVEEKFLDEKKVEDEVYEKLRSERDNLIRARLEYSLQSISERRKGMEDRLNHLQRRIRGYKRELETIEKRIRYLTPTKTGWVEEKS